MGIQSPFIKNLHCYVRHISCSIMPEFPFDTRFQWTTTLSLILKFCECASLSGTPSISVNSVCHHHHGELR